MGDNTPAQVATTETPAQVAGTGEPAQVAGETQAFSPEYVRELRQEAAAARVRSRELEARLQGAEEEKLAEQQQWKALADKRAAELAALAPLQERLNTILEATKARNEARIANLPEALRPLVPQLDDPIATAAWLDSAATALPALVPSAPPLNGGAGASPSRSPVTSLTAAELAVAEALGLTADQYASAKKK